MMRRTKIGVVIAALVAAVTAPALLAQPAHAAAYRYWSYWSVSDDAWSFAQRGPTGSAPRDGGVQGWRFAVSPDRQSALKPRVAPGDAFDQVCGSTDPVDGKKRIALIVDFGTAADTRPGDSLPSQPLRSSCVVIASGATGWDVLLDVGLKIRTDSGGMVCGFAGYPSVGCGERVADPAPASPTSAPKSEPGGAGGSDAGNKPAKTATNGRGGATRTTAPDGSIASRSAAAAASSKASSTATASAAATNGSAAASTSAGATAIAPAASGDATPALVDGLPLASETSDGRSPLPLAIGLLVLVGLGVATYVRTRRARDAGTAGPSL